MNGRKHHSASGPLNDPSARISPSVPSLPPPPLPKGHFDSLQDDIVDFPPLSKGHLSKGFVDCLGQVTRWCRQ